MVCCTCHSPLSCAGDWARRVTGKKFDSGELVKGEFQHKLPSGFQSYVLNLRRDKFQDPRVREAMVARVDPRVHFALNCAAASCPPVRAYTAAGFDRATIFRGWAPSLHVAASGVDPKLNRSGGRYFLAGAFAPAEEK